MLSNPTLLDPAQASEQSIAYAEQKQAAAFFASDGKVLPDPNGYLQGIFTGAKLFEKPSALPDTLNYFQLPK